MPGLVHRYPDRVLLLPLDFCSTYCRYCTRSRVVGHGEIVPNEKRLEAIFHYLEETCIDIFTPINRNAFPAAKRAVDCVLSAADEILDGRRIAYALIRPPVSSDTRLLVQCRH